MCIGVIPASVPLVNNPCVNGVAGAGVGFPEPHYGEQSYRYERNGAPYAFGYSGSAWVAGDVLGVAVDLTLGEFRAFKNNVALPGGTVSFTPSAVNFKILGHGNTDNLGSTNNIGGILRIVEADFDYPVPRGYTSWSGI